jgi:hypothetical protein
LRFERVEEGQKRIRIAFVDSDGASVIPTLDATTKVEFRGNEPSVTVPLALVINQLRLPTFGEYSIDLAIDDRHEASIPIVVSRI